MRACACAKCKALADHCNTKCWARSASVDFRCGLVAVIIARDLVRVCVCDKRELIGDAQSERAREARTEELRSLCCIARLRTTGYDTSARHEQNSIISNVDLSATRSEHNPNISSRSLARDISREPVSKLGHCHCRCRRRCCCCQDTAVRLTVYVHY